MGGNPDLFTGSPIQTVILSPAGGCVTVAVTRQEPSIGSMVTESMVVLGSEREERLSGVRTGAVSG